MRKIMDEGDVRKERRGKKSEKKKERRGGRGRVKGLFFQKRCLLEPKLSVSIFIYLSLMEEGKRKKNSHNDVDK